MSILDAIILGLVQGFAEFLPISSSGHLVLVQNILGINQSSVVFEVFLHFATLMAIFIYFKEDILNIKKQELINIAVASIPVMFIGLLFEDQLKGLFGSSVIVASLLIITGIVNIITDRKLEKSKTIKKVTKEIGLKQALIIGIFQAFAILPGISRSGSTVAGGIWQGIDRVKTFRFSFLMVIPVILGASLIQLLEVFKTGIDVSMTNLFVGGFVAFITGYYSLKLFEYVIKKARMEMFGIYCIAAGLISLGFLLI